MYLGKVIGTVVSTIKVPSLEGSKFLPLILLEPAMVRRFWLQKAAQPVRLRVPAAKSRWMQRS